MTSASHVNLVVARGTQLQLYRLVQATESDHNTDEHTTTTTTATTATSNSKASLVLVHEKSLFGRIESLVAFRPAGWPRDLIGVTVRDAKLTVLQFDITRHDFVVVSLHYFETCVLFVVLSCGR